MLTSFVLPAHAQDVAGDELHPFGFTIEALELARKETAKKPDTPPEQLLFRSV